MRCKDVCGPSEELADTLETSVESVCDAENTLSPFHEESSPTRTSLSTHELSSFSTEESTSSGATEPVHDLEYYVDMSASGVEQKVKSKAFCKFRTPNTVPAVLDDHIPYPGGIPSPFPFEEKYKKALKTTREKFTANANYPVFLKIIQRIYDICLAYLARKPSATERAIIATKLCIEYPVLACGTNPVHAIMSVLRKRANNVEKRSNDLLKGSNDASRAQPGQKRKSGCQLSISDMLKTKTNKQQKVAPVLQISSDDEHTNEAEEMSQPITVSPDEASPAEETSGLITMSRDEASLATLYGLYNKSDFKSRKKTIHGMNGRNITGKVLEMFPMYKNPMQCIMDFSIMVDVDGEAMMASASSNWSKFVRAAIPKCMETGTLKTVQDILLKIWGPSCCRHILHVSDNGQVNTTSDQPFLFCHGLDLPVEVYIISDRIPMVSMQVAQNESYKALLLLISVYHILNLEYPVAGSNALAAIAYILAGKLGQKPPGGKFAAYKDFEHSLL